MYFKNLGFLETFVRPGRRPVLPPVASSTPLPAAPLDAAGPSPAQLPVPLPLPVSPVDLPEQASQQGPVPPPLPLPQAEHQMPTPAASAYVPQPQQQPVAPQQHQQAQPPTAANTTPTKSPSRFR